MKLFFIRATAIAVAFLFSIQICWSQDANKNNTADITPEHSVYLALSNQNDVPNVESQEIFDCTDKVFSVVELNNYPEGKYQLSVRWFDPSNTVREHTRYDFNVRSSSPKTRLWAWLSLTRGFGGGMMQFINPAAGLEDFIGIWKIQVSINDKKIGTDNFEVSC